MPNNLRNLSKKQAIKFLKEHGTALMRKNLNWDHISVVKDKECQGYVFSIGTYDLTKEAQVLKVDHLLVEKFKREGKSVPHLLPLLGDLSVEKLGKTFPPIGGFLNLKLHEIRVAPAQETRVESEQVFRPMAGVDLAKRPNELAGALGGFIEATNVINDEKKCFAITAYHVLKGLGVGDNVYSPADSETVLGQLCWYLYNGVADIALIGVEKEKVNSGSKCGFSLGTDLAPLPADGKVKICSQVKLGEEIHGEIVSEYSVIREEEGSDELLSEVREITTTDMASGGDSGSLVLNTNNEVVGLLVKDLDLRNSFFITLDILKKELKTKEDDHTITIKFNKFI